MLHSILTDSAASISEFKKSPSAILQEAEGLPVAVLNHNKPEFYAVPAKLYEDLIQFAEYAQRGTSNLKNIPARFNAENVDMDELTSAAAKSLTSNDEIGGFEECL